MAISSKDFENFVTRGRVEVKVDLTKELEGLSRSQQTSLKNIVGNSFLDSIKESTRKKTSTVKNEAFRKLSKPYRKRKLAAGKGGQPNLRLKNEMLNDLFFKNQADSVTLKITNKKSKAKAENHNHGVTVPIRQFLPTDKGQGFRRAIMNDVNAKIRDFKKSIK